MGWFQHIFQSIPSSDDAKPEHDLDYLVGETLASRSALAAIKRNMKGYTSLKHLPQVQVQEEFRGPVTLVHITSAGRPVATFEIRRRR